MHELGIVFHIIKEVDEIAKNNGGKEVKKVTIEVGEVSSVIPSYVNDCWSWAVKNKSIYMKNCQLEIISLKAISFCDDCKNTYDTVKNGKECPHCHSNNTYLITGDELTIQSISIDD